MQKLAVKSSAVPQRPSRLRDRERRKCALLLAASDVKRAVRFATLSHHYVVLSNTLS